MKSWGEPFESWAKLIIPTDTGELLLDARLKFDPDQGGVLDFMSPRDLPHRLVNLSADVSGVGKLHFPEATFKAESTGLTHEYSFSSRVCILSVEGPDDVLSKACYVGSDFPSGEVFLGHDPVQRSLSENGNEYTLTARNMDTSVIWEVSGASLSFKTSVQSNWSVQEHHRLRPVSSINMVHDKEWDWSALLERLNRLRAMLDFLAYRAHPWAISNFRNASGHRMMHISPRRSEDAPSSSRPHSFFSLRLDDVQSDIGPLLEYGINSLSGSIAFAEQLSLIRYPSRTFEDRLFSSVRALETWDREQRPEGKDNLLERLGSYDLEWQQLGIKDVRLFKWLLRNTRNQLAHLAVDSGKPSFNENDSYRAFFQCVAACRSSMLRSGGLNPAAIETYLQRIAKRIEAFYGPTDYSGYSVTPSKV